MYIFHNNVKSPTVKTCSLQLLKDTGEMSFIASIWHSKKLRGSLSFSLNISTLHFVPSTDKNGVLINNKLITLNMLLLTQNKSKSIYSMQKVKNGFPQHKTKINL